MASALRAGGSTSRPISERISSTCTMSLRILLDISGPLTLAVPLGDLARFQTTDTRMHARPGAHREDQHDLAGARRARHAHFHRVEVAAHVSGVDMRERHVERRAGRA